jgi:succinyl-CoA synthetase beta subunit
LAVPVGAHSRIRTDEITGIQAKELLAKYGVPVPKGQVATTPEQVFEAAKALGGTAVVKAQVLAGGRGKAGGVKVAKTAEEARDFAASILGKELYFEQAKGNFAH